MGRIFCNIKLNQIRIGNYIIVKTTKTRRWPDLMSMI